MIPINQSVTLRLILNTANTTSERTQSIVEGRTEYTKVQRAGATIGARRATPIVAAEAKSGISTISVANSWQLQEAIKVSCAC